MSYPHAPVRSDFRQRRDAVLRPVRPEERPKLLAREIVPGVEADAAALAAGPPPSTPAVEHAAELPASGRPRWQFVAPSAIPGFPLAFGFSVLYLSLIVLIPLGGVVLWAASLGPSQLLAIATDARVVAAFKVSFGLAFAAAAVNGVFGLITAWVLTRYSFPGKRVIDAIVDLPFALPTAVAGIALAAIYAPNGWVGKLLAPLGIKVAYTPLGIFVALVFVGLPFIVRTLQPVLAEFDRELEEASATLGAPRWKTVRHVMLPTLVPALLTGFALAFARGVGEYGSVIFIAGNIPYVSEIAPLLIVQKLESFDYGGATAIATLMLAASFLILLAINLTEAWSRRRLGHVR